jgi:hypothetical protein
MLLFAWIVLTVEQVCHFPIAAKTGKQFNDIKKATLPAVASPYSYECDLFCKYESSATCVPLTV